MSQPAPDPVGSRKAGTSPRAGLATLLDVNVLVALAWPNHIHHTAAHKWFGQIERRPFATCPVTQSGFVRVSSNKRIIPDGVAPAEARAVLRRIVALPGHVFWADDIDLAKSEHIAWERLGSHYQVTDAHLLALAVRHGGRLATFDRDLGHLDPASGRSVVLLSA
jgi:toxin-antitoxin system PIN domain toxin